MDTHYSFPESLGKIDPNVFRAEEVRIVYDHLVGNDASLKDTFEQDVDLIWSQLVGDISVVEETKGKFDLYSWVSLYNNEATEKLTEENMNTVKQSAIKMLALCYVLSNLNQDVGGNLRGFAEKSFMIYSEAESELEMQARAAGDIAEHLYSIYLENTKKGGSN